MGEKAWRDNENWKQVRWRYKITKEEFDAKVEKQNGKCACGKVLLGGIRRPHVDHDHSCCPGGNTPKCGKCTRGILCFRCNVVLGFYRNELDLLPEYLKEYLKQYGTNS